MYLVKSLGPTNGPIHAGVSIPWATNQIGLVSASVIDFYRGMPNAFTVLAGPDFSDVLAAALTTLSDIRLSTGVSQLSGASTPVAFVAAVAGTKVYASAGANNNLTVTAKVAGAVGNAYTVSCVQGAGVSTPLSVVYTAGATVITLPSDGAGDPVVATANQVKVAWDASAAFEKMTIAVEGSGAGTVAVFASAPLLTGADVIAGSGGGFAGPGSEYTALDTGKQYLNSGTAAEPVWKIVTSA